jgi:hypothetical protein
MFNHSYLVHVLASEMDSVVCEQPETKVIEPTTTCLTAGLPPTSKLSLCITLSVILIG